MHQLENFLIKTVLLIKYYHLLVVPHKNPILLKHLNKRLYEEALGKFANSSLLHISFSHFLFESLRNCHAALIELNICIQKNPSWPQQFINFRTQVLIETFIKEESSESKDIYSELTNVIDFEKLVNECQKSIEAVCFNQIEFWVQVTNPIPDLNVLHDLCKKLNETTVLVEVVWRKISKINSNYPKALTFYGNYMNEIRNNYQIGLSLLEV